MTVYEIFFLKNIGNRSKLLSDGISCFDWHFTFILNFKKKRGSKIMKKLIILLAILSFNVTAKPVNINSADATTLSESLSGIGQKKAEAIVQYRMDNGEFESLSDLTNVKGIGEKTVEKNADDILFSDPEAVEKPKKGKKKK